jgi:hypothetical protein
MLFATATAGATYKTCELRIGVPKIDKMRRADDRAIIFEQLNW